jgi:hypothetical protein
MRDYIINKLIIKSNIMKNLIIALFITLASFTTKAQEQFNGIWLNEGSDYLKTILASEYSVLQCFNTSFEQQDVITEELIKKSKTSFTTILRNPANGYEVTIEYTLINKDSISSKYTGDLHGTYGLTKLH